MSADLVIQVLGPAGVCVAILGAAVKVLLGMLADEKKDRENWTDRTLQGFKKMGDEAVLQREQRTLELTSQKAEREADRALCQEHHQALMDRIDRLERGS